MHSLTAVLERHLILLFGGRGLIEEKKGAQQVPAGNDDVSVGRVNGLPPRKAYWMEIRYSLLF